MPSSPSPISTWSDFDDFLVAKHSSARFQRRQRTRSTMASSAFPSLTQNPRAFPLPTVAEDTLIYAVHLPKSSSSTSTSAVYEDAAAFATLVTSFIDSILGPTWLWNKDGWELKPADDDRKLEGRMRVGDAVDDEWLVVWLLREVSKKWPELVISVRDTDGEFLLIEAANELPKWVTPSNAENRLWLHNSHLHLLPLELRSPLSTRPQKPKFDGENEDDEYPEDLEGWINEKDALRFTTSGQYQAPKEVEDAVWRRIACYPDAMSTHHHLTMAYIPEPIAKALSVAPELVQKAVEGFYTRDPAQLRAASRLTHFPPSPAVLAPVTMTRAAYAQLQGQVFHPPKAFGPEWHVRAAEGENKDAAEKERRWRDIGVKLTVGFEIMYKEGGKRDRAGQPQASAEVRESDSEYQAFVDRLSRLDFFGSETKGSQGWRVKEAEAAKGWRSLKNSDSAQRASFASQVDAAIAAAADVPRMTYEANALNQEDSDDWLTVDPDELDGMMLRASGRDATRADDEQDSSRPMDLDDSHAKALSDLAAKVGKFVEGEGDIEGARFEDELSDEEMPLDDDNDDDDDADEEMTAQEKDARIRALVPELPASEWGRKPEVAEISGSSSKDARPPKSKLGSPPKMRAPLLARDDFDGHIEESDDESDDDEPKAPAGSMGRIIGDMAWGGPDEETRAARVEEITEEEEARQDAEAKRSVRWDDDDQVEDEEAELEPDMRQEEEEFLKFTREQLGITEDMWQRIMSERKARGAFIPDSVTNPTSTKLPKITQPDPSLQKHKPEPLRTSNVDSQRFGSVAPATPFAPPTRTKPEPRIENGLNMELDSFDKVMEAMDDELSKARKSAGKDAKKKKEGPSLAEAIAKEKKKPSTSSANPLPPLPTEADLDALDDDELMEMDRELRAALKGAGIEDSDDDMDGEYDPDEAKELQGEARDQYKMMRDFLESYKSQGGESGVVGNLFGRLGENKQ